ncbi:MAG TPA: type IV pilus assembly protein PilM, partial [Gaiellaceae bacterium]|nr:type IV pilus assembly protein PilM [Gaiellaceae bacterium]
EAAEEHDAEPTRKKYKREFSFRRKRGRKLEGEAELHGAWEAPPDGVLFDEPLELDPVPELQPESYAFEEREEKKAPFFKRELSFRRRKETPDFEFEQAGESPEPEPAPIEDEPVAESEPFVHGEALERKTPFYQRELSFRRTRTTDEGGAELDLEPAAPVDEAFVGDAKAEPEPQPVAFEPEPFTVEPDSVAVEPDAVEPDSVAVEPEPFAVGYEHEPELGAVEPEPESVTLEHEHELAPIASEPAPAPEPEPVAFELEPRPEPAAFEPAPEPEPVVLETDVPVLELPEESLPAAAEADLGDDLFESAWAGTTAKTGPAGTARPDEAVLPEEDALAGWDAVDLPTADPAVVELPGHDEPEEWPAVAAEGTADLPELTRIPFYKREISFGRKKEAQAPADLQAPAPVPALTPGEPPEDTRPSTGGSRRGLSFLSRRPRQAIRSKRVVGVKIGASQVAAAVVVKHDGRNELVQLARRPLEAGIVVDGEVRDPDGLANALRTLFDEHKLPRTDIRVGLASNRIGIRAVDVVGVQDDERFDNAVRFKAHEVLPIALHESVLDYRVIHERPNEAGETIRHLLLVVAPRDQVEPYVDAFANAGLTLGSIDLEALALLRAFVEPTAALRADDDTATVVVAMGHEVSTLLVSGGGACEFARVFHWGGATLQDAVAHELQVHPAEAATILRQLSLADGKMKPLEGLETVDQNRVLDAVRRRLTPFARELVASLQFYQAQPGSLGIGEIVITGGTSHLDGLADVLMQMIGVDVRVGDPLARVVVGKHALDQVSAGSVGSLAVAIGLGIDDEPTRTIDLFPRDDERETTGRSRLVTVLVPAGVAVPILLLGFLFVQARGAAGDREDRLSVLQAQLAALPPTPAPTPTGPSAEVSSRAAALGDVLGRRLTWDGVLRDVARVLPADVWLTDFSAEVSQPLGDAAAAAAPGAQQTGVEISGYTYSQADVAELLARLATVPSLGDVQLKVSAGAEIGKRAVTQFTIAANLRDTGGAS